MSSNNLDEKLVLGYISNFLISWGIQVVNENILRLAKKNIDEVSKSMCKILFSLCILHMLDFQYLLDELQISIDQSSQQQLYQIILAHLSQIKCPYLLQKQGQVAFDFTSSRKLLLLCGWVMAVSDIFTKTLSMLKKKVHALQTKRTNTKSQKINYPLKKHHLSAILEHQKTNQQISILMKSLKIHKYQIDCLLHKNQILSKKIQKIAINQKINVNQLLHQPVNDNKIYEQQCLNLIYELQNIKQGLKYQQYFWIWLDQKIIPMQHKKLQQEHTEIYEKLQPLQGIKKNIRVDTNYLTKFIEKMVGYNQRIENCSDKISKMGIKSNKKYKQIDQQINYEINNLLTNKNQKEEYQPSFIAIQISQYLERGGLTQKKIAVNNQKQKIIEKSKLKFRRQLYQYIVSLDQLMFI